MKRQGVEMSMTVIIVAAIAIIILLVLIYFISKSSSGLSGSVSCPGLGGTCSSTATCPTGHNQLKNDDGWVTCDGGNPCCSVVPSG